MKAFAPLKTLLHKMRSAAFELNKKNILELLETDASGKMLDLGCDDGNWTMEILKKTTGAACHGLDIVQEKLDLATQKGIIAKSGDLNKKLPYENDFFDCVHANQVIEHLFDTDTFLEEIHRMLKKNGYAIISTENLASWVNIFSLMLGWQPFSITNISKKRLGIGNPFAINRGETQKFESWLHVKVMSARALKELFEAHGFKVEKIVGAGYFPFPAILGKFDPTHSHFITIKARKIAR